MTRPNYFHPMMAADSVPGKCFICPLSFCYFQHTRVGQYSAVGITIHYRPDSMGTTSHGGKIFHAHPDWSWGPPSLLYDGYRISFLGVKQLEHAVNHPLPLSTKVQERVKLYLYSPLP